MGKYIKIAALITAAAAAAAVTYKYMTGGGETVTEPMAQ